MPDILTTHVGSLPRGPELVPLLLARDHGRPYDAAAFEQLVQSAVEAAVAQQQAAGVSIVSDGELGKVGYSTYITERLSGFGGHVERKPALDLAALPELRRKLAAIMGAQEFVRASCVGPVRLVNLDPCHEDIRRFTRALAGRGVPGFMNAASPGLITAFQPNAFYPSHEAYLADLVSAMRPEYTAIAASGLLLQLDCPDLAMARHTGYQDLSEAEFLGRRRQRRGLNAATADIPGKDAHARLLGNTRARTTTTSLWSACSASSAGAPGDDPVRGGQCTPRAEWKVRAAAKLPADKILAPGLIDTRTNYVEHPELVAQRLERFAAIVGIERVIASTDCGFGTFAGYGKIDPAVTWKKLRALRAGADLAAARLQ
jgi:5-methyltetrahydropteroyltriglutamate--homocysteine methyltransferase